MNIERALNIRTRARVSIAGLYSCARLAGYTSKDICDGKAAILADMPKGTPQWVRAYIDGYCDALNAELYDNWLVFGGYVDGVFYSTDSKRDDYYRTQGIDLDATRGRVTGVGHYWKERVQYRGGIYSRDTVKPYFVA